MITSRLNFYNIKWKYRKFVTAVYYRRVMGAIGKGSTVCKPMHINHPECIYCGEHVYFRDFARIEAVCEYDNQHFSPKIQVGDNTRFEQGLHLTCGDLVKIGRNCIIMSYVMITDLTHKYDDLNMNVLDQPLSAASVEIGDDCYIGSGARIMPGVHLGKHCVIEPNSVVVGGDYPDYSVIAGMPARYIKRYSYKSQKWEKTDAKGNFFNEV